MFQVPRPGENGYFYMNGEGWMMRVVILIAHLTVSLGSQHFYIYCEPQVDGAPHLQGSAYRVKIQNQDGTYVSEVYNVENMSSEPPPGWPRHPDQRDSGAPSH